MGSKKVFDMDISTYMTKIHNFIQAHFTNVYLNDALDIQIEQHKGEKIIDKVILKIEDGIYKSDAKERYRCQISQVIQEESSNSIFTLKYTYNLQNTEDEDDFIRFDFHPNSHYDSFHINVSKKIWHKDHMSYPSDTNLNLKKLDVFKALRIFEKYINNPDIHPLNQDENEEYIKILEGKH